jgi:ribosome-associated translation inhibitor RaiA
MRIPVTGEDVVITNQLRTYVEYRLFTSVVRYQALISAINVTLGPNRGNGGGIVCVVDVGLRQGGQIKIRASGAYPHVAIDRAADRTFVVLSRRTSQRVSF